MLLFTTDQPVRDWKESLKTTLHTQRKFIKLGTKVTTKGVMAVFSAFQAMRLILLVSVLYDAVGKSCRSSFSCLKDQVCCDHKCIYGPDCLGSLCALDSDCSVGQSCCSNKCKHGLHCVGSRCSESNDCGVYESCCFGTCSYDVDCKLYRTIELVGIICGATMLLCVIFVCVFWAYHRRHTEVRPTLNSNTSFVTQANQAQPYHARYLDNPLRQYQMPSPPPPYSPETTSLSEHHPYSSAARAEPGTSNGEERWCYITLGITNCIRGQGQAV